MVLGFESILARNASGDQHSSGRDAAEHDVDEDSEKAHSLFFDIMVGTTSLYVFLARTIRNTLHSHLMSILPISTHPISAGELAEVSTHAGVDEARIGPEFCAKTLCSLPSRICF